MTRLSGWGRYPVGDYPLNEARCEADVLHALSAGSLIARGNGRAYGDAAASLSCTLDMRGMNRMLSFDAATGELTAEAGILLSDIIATFLPQGWFPAVTPGTRHVTLGGMIAADVHGKNHHRNGSMRTCISWIDLLCADGVVRRCSPTEDPELFDHSCGGMGLTGVILRSAIRLRAVRSAWIRQRTIAAPNLDSAMGVFEANGAATYSVAWIDTLSSGRSLGRSLVMLGEHAEPDELSVSQRQRPFDVPARRRLSVPFDLPNWALNGSAVRLFNGLYYRAGLHKAERTQFVSYDSYFYPLDAISGWNRIYGSRGFLQFQCVLPLERSREGLGELLGRIAASGRGSFLAVLKRFGAQSSPFSFPMEGYTLALDFPISPRTVALYETLEAVTIAHGGRFYLAKDARMSAATLRAADERTDDFAAFRGRRALKGNFASSQSERLDI